MAVDGGIEAGRRAAVVGVGVAEHDPLQAAQLRGRRARPLRPRLAAGVEHGHAAALLPEEGDVHPLAQVAAQQPHPVGNPLESHRRSVPRLGSAAMPLLWKAGMALLVVCLVAAMAIAIVRLPTTPTD